MDNKVKNFHLKLLITLIVVFLIHIGVLNFSKLPLFENKIVLSYIVNFILASIIFNVIYSFREKQKENLGFIFIGGSLFKFVVFFLVFYPFFKANGNIDKLEFLSFFVPYIICLFLETFALSKLLNKLYQNKQ